MGKIESMGDFAETIHDLLISDRLVIVGTGGFPGGGKTRFSDALLREFRKKANTYYDFDRMTWSRKELLKWIDGEGKEKKGQLPEYSAVHVDELFGMFYKRNWYEKDQIDAITVLNMCRDRHLFICGNIPGFWELDSGFISRVMFYVFIPRRGVAWVFQQEVNPWSEDPWNRNENKKKFRKTKNAGSSHNFVCEIHYEDWTKEEKKRYLAIRNKKRRAAIQQNKSEQQERYSNIKAQRDALLRMVFSLNKKLTHKDIADLTGLSVSAVRLIKEGLR